VRFSRKQQHVSALSFFQGLGEKHLFTTTCIEKHRTRPLSQSPVTVSVLDTYYLFVRIPQPSDSEMTFLVFN